MNINILINQVGILFIVMLIGVYARKKKFVGDEAKKSITDLIVNITLPCMVVASFNQKLSMELLSNAGMVLVISFAIHIGSFFFSKVLFSRYPEDIKSVLRYSAVFSNAAFMGYPVLEGLYGSLGVFYASIYSLPYRIFMWTFGVALFAKGKKQDYVKEIFLNPGILAVFVGLIISVASIQIPIMLSKTISTVGAMTTPLSMIMVGVTLADVKIKGLFKEIPVWYNSVVRLVVLPIFLLLILKSLGIKGIVLAAVVLLTAMPTGAMTTILAGKYDANSSFASKCVFTSTTLSVITIPLIALLIQ